MCQAESLFPLARFGEDQCIDQANSAVKAERGRERNMERFKKAILCVVCALPLMFAAGVAAEQSAHTRTSAQESGSAMAPDLGWQ